MEMAGPVSLIFLRVNAFLTVKCNFIFKRGGGVPYDHLHVHGTLQCRHLN